MTHKIRARVMTHKILTTLTLTDEEWYKLIDMAVNEFGWPPSETSNRTERDAAAGYAAEQIVWREIET